MTHRHSGGRSIFQTIRKFPEQFMAGLESAMATDLGTLATRRPRRIFYAAMGGSSLPADLTNDVLGEDPPLLLVRDYRLPESAGPDDWVICASFSGNTEETLGVFEAALAKGCPTIALSHGGILKSRARAESVPHVALPSCIQPRCATGYFFASLMALLFKAGRIPDPKDALTELGDYLASRQELYEKEGKCLAEGLVERIPIIYGPTELNAACRIWKIKFNENCKIQSFYNVFPEINHNEMVGFTHLLMKPALIYLISQFMAPKILTRMKVMREILEKEIPFFEISLQGKDCLQENFEALAIGDYASYFLAKSRGVDPTPVAMVEQFKRRLA